MYGGKLLPPKSPQNAWKIISFMNVAQQFCIWSLELILIIPDIMVQTINSWKSITNVLLKDIPRGTAPGKNRHMYMSYCCDANERLWEKLQN